MAFCYTLAASTWQTNFRELEAVAKHIGFEEIRKPNVAINNQLHDLRRDLDRLRKDVKSTQDWMPEKVREELTDMKGQTTKHIETPEESCRQILAASIALEKFLMDSFTLLLSSISVKEAEINAKTSERAQLLTTLAFVYVPLSFVTGIFGMNINEINGSKVPAWIPAVTLGATLSLTFLIVPVIYLRQQRIRDHH